MFLQVAQPRFSVADCSNRLCRELSETDRQMISKIKKQIKTTCMKQQQP